VRLVVQVLAADLAEPGAVGAAEDLVGQCERDRIAGPGRDGEHVALDVLGRHLLVVRLLVLVLARPDRQLEHGVTKAAVARPVQADSEGEGEDRPGTGPCDPERGRHLVGHRQVALSAEIEG